MSTPGSRLREALLSPPVQMPGVFNALAARMAERLGFRALYFSGGALSAGWAGPPDIGLLTLSEFADQARVITAATSLPILSDADTGFGEPVNVERTVRLFESAGLAGLHLEDQQLPKRCGHLSGKSLVDPDTMARKIRAAVAARRDPSFVIVARTDARSVEGLDAAILRARLYRDAGADLIFPEALETPDEFDRFAAEVPAPLLANMTEFGKSPLLNVEDLARLGYHAVIHPLSAFRAAMLAAEHALRTLRDTGSSQSLLPNMLTRARLYDLLDYNDFEQRDRSYFEHPTSES